MKRLLNLLSVLLISLALAYNAYAEVATIAVSPVTKSMTLSTGESRRGTFMVLNDSSEVQYVTVDPRYWHMADVNKKIPLDSWLKITPREFELGPMEEREVAYDVTVPEEAIGELAVMIAFRPSPKEEQGVNVVFSVSLYVMIKETGIIDYKISGFKLDKLMGRDALSVKVDLKNLGNVHLKPRITVFIQNLFNKDLQKTFLKYGKPTYPGMEQDYHGAIYNFKLKPGIYKAVIDTEYTNVGKRFKRSVYFVVGRRGRVLFTFFKEA